MLDTRMARAPTAKVHSIERSRAIGMGVGERGGNAAEPIGLSSCALSDTEHGGCARYGVLEWQKSVLRKSSRW